MVDQQDDGPRLHRHQLRPAADHGTSFEHVSPAAVPGRASSTDRLPPAPRKAVARRALLAVDGAIARVDAMRPQLGAALDAGSYLESGRLSLEVRTAIQRAATGLRPHAQDPEHSDAAAAAVERLRNCAASVASLLGRAPVLEAPGAGTEAAQKAWEADAMPVAAGSHATWDADAQELTRAAGLPDVDVRSDDEARSLTDAHRARGVALGSTVFLHPDRTKPGSPEGREVLAHELVHLAQAQLGAGDSLVDHAAAEQEAAELAPRLARGAAVAPRQRIDLSQPAADTGGAVATSLAQAELLVASALRKFAVVRHLITANDVSDRPSASVAPELRAIGTLLATARTLIESAGTGPDARSKQAEALRARITSLAADVEKVEVRVTSTAAVRATSHVAAIMGDEQPEPDLRSPAFTRGARLKGPMSGMQAEAYIRNTPDVYDAIYKGVNGALLGTGRVVIHDSYESYVKAHREMLENDGLPHVDIDAEARSEASSSQGVTDPMRGVAHVLATIADRDTTIHELIHVYASQTAGAVGNLPGPMLEGAADYFTELVCNANGIAFRVGYSSELRAFKALVAEVGFTAAASMVFSGSKTVPDRIELLGAGSWKKYAELWRTEKFGAATKMVRGLGHMVAVHDAKERADRPQRENDDPDMVKARQDAEALREAERAEDTWAPEGQSARGTVLNVQVAGNDSALKIHAGGKRGVRDGWRATIRLNDGQVIEGTVTRTSSEHCYVMVSRGLGPYDTDANTTAELRRAP